MSGATSVYQSTDPLKAENLPADFSQLEATQKKVNPYLSKLAETSSSASLSSNHTVHNLKAAISRLREILENYFHYKHDYSQKKEESAKGSVSNLQSYTYWQGYTSLGGATVGVLLGIAGLKDFSQLSTFTSQTVNQFIDGWKQKDEFEKQNFFSNHEKTPQELKGLLQQLQQVLKEFGDLELQGVRTTAR